jgi:hypothetical protein
MAVSGSAGAFCWYQDVNHMLLMRVGATRAANLYIIGASLKGIMTRGRMQVVAPGTKYAVESRASSMRDVVS